MGVWKGVAMDYLKLHRGPDSSTPCGRATSETAAGRVACGRLLPLWTPHAVRLWEGGGVNV
jgi:hypothetical protein